MNILKGARCLLERDRQQKMDAHHGVCKAKISLADEKRTCMIHRLGAREYVWERGEEDAGVRGKPKDDRI